jgi:hypothetical protein
MPEALGALQLFDAGRASHRAGLPGIRQVAAAGRRSTLGGTFPRRDRRAETAGARADGDHLPCTVRYHLQRTEGDAVLAGFSVQKPSGLHLVTVVGARTERRGVQKHESLDAQRLSLRLLQIGDRRRGVSGQAVTIKSRTVVGARDGAACTPLCSFHPRRRRRGFDSRCRH